MERIRVGHTDVIFDEIGDGAGKIIISNDDYGYNFSHYWGAMGKDTLKQFVCSIDTGYFTNKLCSHINGPMNVKKTFVGLRKSIQESFEYELEWYQHLEFQKDFREKLKKFQKEVSCREEFVNRAMSFHKELNYYLIEEDYERERIEELFKGIFSQCEPWTFLEYNPHPEQLFLEKLHVKLKKVLSKPVQLRLF